MTILITGGAGFIGGHTVLALIDRGEIPIVLDDLSTGNRAAVPSGVPFFAGDVGDMELVLRLVQNHRIDAILHFAANSRSGIGSRSAELLPQQHGQNTYSAAGSGARKRKTFYFLFIRSRLWQSKFYARMRDS